MRSDLSAALAATECEQMDGVGCHSPTIAVPKVSMATPLHRRGLGAGRQWSGESTASVGPAAENRPKVTDA